MCDKVRGKSRSPNFGGFLFARTVRRSTLHLSFLRLIFKCQLLLLCFFPLAAAFQVNLNWNWHPFIQLIFQLANWPVSLVIFMFPPVKYRVIIWKFEQQRVPSLSSIFLVLPSRLGPAPTAARPPFLPSYVTTVRHSWSSVNVPLEFQGRGLGLIYILLSANFSLLFYCSCRFLVAATCAAAASASAVVLLV